MFISVDGDAAAVEDVAAAIVSMLGVHDDPLALRRISPASVLLVLPDGAAVARRVRSPLSSSGPAGGAEFLRGGSGQRPVWVRLGPTASCSANEEASPSPTATAPVVGSEDPRLNSRDCRDVRDMPLTEAIQSASTFVGGAATSSACLDRDLRSIGVQGSGIDVGPLGFGPPADLGPGPNISFGSALPSALFPAVDAELPGGPSSPVAGVPEGRLASAAGSEPREVQTTREVPGQASVFPGAENSPLHALEALVFVETVASRAHASPALADGALKVYYRRRRRTRTHSPPRESLPPPQPAVQIDPPTQPADETHRDIPQPTDVPPQDHDPATLSRKTFINNLTKKTDGLLTRPPTIRKRQTRPPPPTSAPRRSRRTAGLDPEFAHCPDIGARKTVIRSLNLAMEQEHVDQRILNDYAKLFSHPLSTSHIQALAALFGWAVPEGTGNISFLC